MIHENEPATPPDDAEIRRWSEYMNRLRASGALIAGESLHPASAAKTVRKQDDRVQVRTGPVAPAKDQLSGFFVIECGDMDEAVTWAADVPSLHRAPVEVRPIKVME